MHCRPGSSSRGHNDTCRAAQSMQVNTHTHTQTPPLKKNKMHLHTHTHTRRPSHTCMRTDTRAREAAPSAWPLLYSTQCVYCTALVPVSRWRWGTGLWCCARSYNQPAVYGHFFDFHLYLMTFITNQCKSNFHGLKGKFTQKKKGEFSWYLLTPHADGKSDEVLQSSKHLCELMWVLYKALNTSL